LIDRFRECEASEKKVQLEIFLQLELWDFCPKACVADDWCGVPVGLSACKGGQVTATAELCKSR